MTGPRGHNGKIVQRDLRARIGCPARHNIRSGAAHMAACSTGTRAQIGGYSRVCRRSADHALRRRRARVRRAISHSERTGKGALTARLCGRKRSLTWHNGRSVAQNFPGRQSAVSRVTHRAWSVAVEVVAVEVGFEPTEGLPLHTLSSTAHHRSPPSASVLTSVDRWSAYAGERLRTGVNETKTEPTAWRRGGRRRPARALADSAK